jgi:small conductance mechanosensitive channel
MKFHSLDHWFANDLLPTGLIVLGAWLVIRLTHWAGRVFSRELDREAHHLVVEGKAIPDRTKRSRAVGQAAEWAAVSLVCVVSGILALSELGLPLTSLVAPATVAGVAIGFGAQQIVSDVLAGFFLLAERQFGVGDVIRLSAAGELTGISGTVEGLTLRVTKLRSQQGDMIVIPNSALRQVTNLSKDWSRVVIDIPVAADEDLQRVIVLIDHVASSMAAEASWRLQILGDPVVAGVETIEVGYVQLRLLVRTLPGRQFDVGRELRLRIAVALRNEHVLTPVAGPAGPSGP